LGFEDQGSVTFNLDSPKNWFPQDLIFLK